MTSTGLIDIGATKIKEVEAKPLKTVRSPTLSSPATCSLVVTNDTIKSVTVTNLGEV